MPRAGQSGTTATFSSSATARSTSFVTSSRKSERLIARQRTGVSAWTRDPAAVLAQQRDLADHLFGPSFGG